VAKNIYENVPKDEMREIFKAPDFVQKMLEKGWLGNKSGQGFYKRVKSEAGKEKLVLDYKTMEYRPSQKVKYPSLDAAKSASGADKAKALIYADDRAGRSPGRSPTNPCSTRPRESPRSPTMCTTSTTP
jgi:3-hydroxyacyl-CoA dehydrogenase